MLENYNDFCIQMVGVKELTESFPVELVFEQGHIAIRARNEAGNNETIVDLWSLIDWMRFGPSGGRSIGGFILPLDEN
jgi:hypothetical protein